MKMTGRSMREEVTKSKEKPENFGAEVEEVTEGPSFFGEYGEEFELLKTDMSRRRRSEEVVKMQDRHQMKAGRTQEVRR